jgi:2-polyprenyl-3-methyl-5-hydroxy-6-metoxy-1,4-benzoquinol methylase
MKASYRNFMAVTNEPIAAERAQMSPEGTKDVANGYELAAEEFIARRSDSRIGISEVRDWAKALPRGASVLDLGCGHGVPISQVLIEEGCSVWGVDASPTLVSAFQVRFPAFEVECAPVEASQFFSKKFDGVVAWGLVFLLERATQALLFEKISNALAPTGRLLFTAPRQTCEWMDILTQRHSVSLGADAYRRILEDCGMALVDQLQDEGENHYYLAEKRQRKTASKEVSTDTFI